MNGTGILKLVKAHKLATALVAAALLFVIYQAGGGIVSGVRSRISSAQVTQTQAEAHAAQAQAAQSLTEANASSVNRQVEDGYRERTINPELKRTAQVVESTRARAREAQITYENAQKPFHRPELDERALHQRNCADLARLFEAERFNRCE